MSSADAAWPRWASSPRPPPSSAPRSARATAAAATAPSRRAKTAAGKQAPAPKPTELPLGGRQIFPRFRVVAYYGAPQAHALGALGIGSPDHAVRRLAQQAKPYAKQDAPGDARPRAAGRRGQPRSRAPTASTARASPPSIINRYLAAARRAKALLVLDIQPGHADFLTETRHLDRWLREPDVGLALDPEWHTPGAVPGTQIGSVQAEDVNAVARHVAAIVRRYNLPEKLFVVHQFTPDMIAGKERVQQPPGLAVTMNVDGFGDRPNKISKYHQFTHDGTHFHRGYKLFYEEDTNLMTPGSVLALQPRPDLVVYE